LSHTHGLLLCLQIATLKAALARKEAESQQNNILKTPGGSEKHKAKTGEVEVILLFSSTFSMI